MLTAPRLKCYGAAVIALLVITSMACGDDKSQGLTNFKRGEGTVTVSGGDRLEASLGLQQDDTAFFGQENADESSDALGLSLRSSDNRVWVSLLLLNVKGRGEHVLDSETEGSLTVLIGETCNGGMGDLLGDGCHWYASSFYNADCKAIVETANAKRAQGRVECMALGANCPAGTGVRSASGACSDGERYEPISLMITFRLEEPLTLLNLSEDAFNSALVHKQN